MNAVPDHQRRIVGGFPDRRSPVSGRVVSGHGAKISLFRSYD